MKRITLVLLLVPVFALVWLSFGQSGASADSGSATFRYLAGGGLPLCGLNPAFCPDVAMAENGDTITIAGEGMLSIHPKSATGHGTFVHKNAAGAVLGTGTWTATDLLSFNDYGTGLATLPQTWHGGRALIRVHLVAASGAQFDGTLIVTCLLPGAKTPKGFEEGIRLNVPHMNNFNMTVSGNTLFIKQ